jgi:hypothetical protein
MPIRCSCPHCGHVLVAPDNRAGTRCTCSACKGKLVVPGMVAQPAPRRAAAPLSPVLSATCPGCGRAIPVSGPHELGLRIECARCGTTFTPRGGAAPAEQTRESPYQPPPVFVEPAPSGAAAHSLGIASLVLGVLCVVLALIPCVGMIALPLAAVGLLLGIIGGGVALARKGRGIGFPIAGSATNLLALAVGGVWLLLSLSTAGHLARENKTRQSRVPIGESGSQPLEKTPAQPEDEWVDASTGGVTQGDVLVVVKAVEQTGYFRADGSQEGAIRVKLQVTNNSQTRKVDYHGWGVQYLAAAEIPRLTDNFGNTYKTIHFEADEAAGQVRSAAIYPGNSLNDYMTFEAPVKAAEYVHLELPAKNFGGTGQLRLKIPATMFRH